MKKSESIIELAKALSKFQGEVKQPHKDKTNPHFKSNFVSLEGVVEAITSTASKHGLSYVQFPINEDDKVGIYTVILHDSGEWIESSPIFTKIMKQDPQAVGSALSYLRRYSLSAVFGITSENDDDSEAAMGRGQAPQQTYQQPPKPAYQAPQNNGQAPNLISPAQVGLIKTKLSIISNKDTEKMVETYNNALNNLGFDSKLKTNELNKSQASKVIEYLTSIEPGK